jgi:cytoskeleton protein RodZ
MQKFTETGLSTTEVGEGFVLTNPVPEPQEPASVGEFLAAAREHAGLSVNDVASRLRMSVKQIEALERADYTNLPAGTFLRGFVRNYAKAVGANIDEALAVLEKTHRDALAVNATAVVAPTIAAAPVAFQPRGEALATPKSRALIALLLIICLAAVVWYWWEFVRPHRADGGRPREVPVVVQPEVSAATPAPVTPTADVPSAEAKAASEATPGIGPVVAPELKSAASGSPLTSPISTPPAAPVSQGVATPQTSSAPVGAPATAPAASATAAPKAAPPASATPAKPSPTPSEKSETASADSARTKKPTEAGAAGVLGFTFSGESWVEVVDGTGKTVISRRYKAGDADEVSGRGPFTVVVGNAQSTRMAFNGREFDLKPHTRATVARVTVK